MYCIWSLIRKPETYPANKSFSKMCIVNCCCEMLSFLHLISRIFEIWITFCCMTNNFYTKSCRYKKKTSMLIFANLFLGYVHVETSVADPWHFGVDPDPCLWLMDSDPDPDPVSGSWYFRHWPTRCQQKTNFLTKFFLLITFWSYIYIIFQR